MKDPFKQHGAFSWFELTTTDVEGAKKFYSNCRSVQCAAGSPGRGDICNYLRRK
jgi:predicted enzyme related to lactoylglutathione lyase